MRRSLVLLVLTSALLGLPAFAAPIVLDGEVPQDGSAFLQLPFEVPAGTEEIEVRHDDLSADNILDFGVADPERLRGWGGGNTEPAVIGLDAASRSYLPGPIPAGTWNVIVGKAKIVSPPGRYHLEIELRTTATLPPQRERRPYVASPALSTGPRWYAGDFHVHSRESGDAHPTLDEIADFAHARGLDFVVITDHNTVSQLDFLSDVQARHPEVLLIPGVEFTTYAGHANGIGAHQYVDFRLGVQGRTIDDVTRDFFDQGAVFSINHPVLDLGDACIGCAWKHEQDRSRVGAIEIQTGAWSKTGVFFGDRALTYWDAYCARGFRVAALGGSDDHRGGQTPGSLDSAIGSPTTLVYADELSERAIVQAVREGRTVVKREGPDDPMVDLTTAEKLHVGDTVFGHTTLRVSVTGGMGQQVRLVHNGQAQPPVEVTSDPFAYELPITAPETGADRWRAEVVDGKPRTVTSHLWIVQNPGPTSVGCACASDGEDSTLTLAGLLVLGLGFVLRGRKRYRFTARVTT